MIIDTPETELPLPCTLQELIEGYFDIMGTPRRYFFEYLSFFATSPHEKERLDYFVSSEGQEDLRWYNQKEFRTVFQIFQDFPSVKPPLEYLLDMLPRIAPRSFSISSALKVSNKLSIFFFQY